MILSFPVVDDMVNTAFREDAVQLVKETANIADVIGEHVKLVKSGVNLKGLCPFHSEKTPSFIVNPSRRSFHCFGCNEGGDVLSFVMKYHRVTFPEALRELAGKYNIPLPEKPLSPQEAEKGKKRELLFSLNHWAAQQYHDLLLNSPMAKAAREYLDNRGMTGDMIAKFRIGFAPDSWDFILKSLQKRFSPVLAKEAGLLVAKDHGGFYDRFRSRIMFPISGLTGKTVGFGGRILGNGEPKYLNTPETPIFDKSRTLFGLFENRESIRQQNSCLIVEGNFDMLSLVRHGIENAVAPLGTALTQSQLRILKGYTDEIILLFDGDEAGLKASMRSIPLILSENINAKVVVLPEGDDPDTFVSSHGKDKLLLLIQKAQSLPDFAFQGLAKQHGLTINGKGRIIEELKPIINAITDDRLQRTFFLTHFSQKLGVDQEKLEKGLGITSSTPRKKGGQTSGDEMPMNQRQILEYLLIHPDSLSSFIDAGVEDVISHPVGRKILAHLKDKCLDSDQGPESLLGVTEGDVKVFISRVLIDSSLYDNESENNMMEQMLAWLKKTKHKKMQEDLTRQINDAHHSNNTVLMLELMQKKKELDKELLS